AGEDIDQQKVRGEQTFESLPIPPCKGGEEAILRAQDIVFAVHDGSPLQQSARRRGAEDVPATRHGFGLRGNFRQPLGSVSKCAWSPGVAAFAEAARSLPRGGQGAHPSAKTAAARPCASPLHSPTSLPWPRFSPLPPSLTPLARVVP